MGGFARERSDTYVQGAVNRSRHTWGPVPLSQLNPFICMPAFIHEIDPLISDLTVYAFFAPGESILLHISKMLPQLKSRISQQKENAKPVETEVSKKKKQKKKWNLS